MATNLCTGVHGARRNKSHGWPLKSIYSLQVVRNLRSAVDMEELEQALLENILRELHRRKQLRPEEAVPGVARNCA